MNRAIEHPSDKRQFLMGVYIYCDMLYGMSLEDRILIDLGWVSYDPGISEDLDALTDEELEEKLHSLKAPWWEDMYNEVSKDRKLLEILYNRDCKLEDLKTIYEAQQKNDIKTIDYMYRHPLKHSVLECVFSFIGKIFSVSFLKSLIFILLTVSFFICLIVCAFKSI